jgi:adenylate cyclase class 2
MDIEFEVKFINVDFKFLRQQLKKAGARRTHKMRIMRRAIIDTPELKKNNAFIRVRDEGDKVTLTYKQFNKLSIDGARECEVNVSDFQSTINLLKLIGLPYRSFQESKRESWLLDGAEIVLDEWPWLNPYIEIEGDGEAHVRNISEILGFSWSDAIFGDIMSVYRIQYPSLKEDDLIGNIPEVRFGDPPPKMLSLD